MPGTGTTQARAISFERLSVELEGYGTSLAAQADCQAALWQGARGDLTDQYSPITKQGMIPMTCKHFLPAAVVRQPMLLLRLALDVR